MIFDWFYGLDMAILYPITIVLVAGASEIGNWFGRRFRRANTENADVSTLAAASLGLLALLIAFSFNEREADDGGRFRMVSLR